MNTIRLQDYKDGAIYKTVQGTYLIKTSEGQGEGKTVDLALKDLESKAELTVEPEEKKTRKNKKK